MPKKKVCYLDPVFPKEAFIVMLFIFQEDKIVGLEALQKVFSSSFEASEQIKKEIVQLADSGEYFTATIAPDAIIVPIRFVETYSLKPEFWESPIVHLDPINRTKLFSSVLKDTSAYHLLVTPRYIDEEGNQILDVAYPFSGKEAKRNIEIFMQTSDQVVDTRAKYAGIYLFENQQKFNWLTGVVEDIDVEYPGMN